MAWVFQYDPTDYDLATATESRLSDWWVMNRGRNLVAVRDIVYFLRSGPMAAVTAVGEITRATYPRVTERGDAAVDFVVKSFVDPELTRDEILEDDELRHVYVLAHGMQGTNFQLTEERARALQARLDGRLRAAAIGGAPASMPLLRRSETALAGSLEAIKTNGGQVVAVQVQFFREPQDEPEYQDRRVDDETILLVGRGKRMHGDQRLTHGNAALERVRSNGGREHFPVYEKSKRGLYRYLGDFTVSGTSYAELDEAVPGYKVYRFVLKRVPEVGRPPASLQEQDVAADFHDDISRAVPPSRRQSVRAIVARNRALVADVRERADYRCERCGNQTRWTTAQGRPYVEVHHIIELGENGSDHRRNMIALCADCHRYLHLGSDRVREIERLREERGL